MIDRGFYAEIYRSSLESDRMWYLRMVKADEALREGWLSCFVGEEERFRRSSRIFRMGAVILTSIRFFISSLCFRMSSSSIMK
jgi:hypothetical protein